MMSHMRNPLTKEDHVQIGCLFGETKQKITVKMCFLLDQFYTAWGIAYLHFLIECVDVQYD